MSPQTVRLREIVTADADFLWELANHPLLLDLLAELPTTREYWRDAITHWSQDSDEADWVIVREGDSTPLGWLGVNGLDGGSDLAWLKFIALLPEHWGRGYATSSIGQVMSWAAARGIRRLRLETDGTNERAPRCYLRHGFRVVGQCVKPTGSRREMRERLLMECLVR